MFKKLHVKNTLQKNHIKPENRKPNIKLGKTKPNRKKKNALQQSEKIMHYNALNEKTLTHFKSIKKLSSSVKQNEKINRLETS